MNAQQLLAGIWNTENENTKIEITEVNDVYEGKIVSSDNAKAKIGKQILKDVKSVDGEWQGKLFENFMEQHIHPNHADRQRYTQDPKNWWQDYPKLEEWKEAAKAADLWNLFLPKSYGELSPGLTNLEYVPLAEIMGWSRGSDEVFNCSAPDTGNMEVFAKYGTPEQQEPKKRSCHQTIMTINKKCYKKFYHQRLTITTKATK